MMAASNHYARERQKVTVAREQAVSGKSVQIDREGWWCPVVAGGDWWLWWVVVIGGDGWWCLVVTGGGFVVSGVAAGVWGCGW